MPDPERCESGAAGPFVWIEGSLVEVWALGEDRFADWTSSRAAPFPACGPRSRPTARPWPTSPTSGSVDPATMSPAELAVALDVSTKPRG